MQVRIILARHVPGIRSGNATTCVKSDRDTRSNQQRQGLYDGRACEQRPPCPSRAAPVGDAARARVRRERRAIECGIGHRETPDACRNEQKSGAPRCPSRQCIQRRLLGGVDNADREINYDNRDDVDSDDPVAIVDIVNIVIGVDRVDEVGGRDPPSGVTGWAPAASTAYHHA